MEFNTIEFFVEHHKVYGGFEYSTIHISIDGLLLSDIMKNVEVEMARQQDETG